MWNDLEYKNFDSVLSRKRKGIFVAKIQRIYIYIYIYRWFLPDLLNFRLPSLPFLLLAQRRKASVPRKRGGPLKEWNDFFSLSLPFFLPFFLSFFLSFFPIATRAANEKEIDMHDTWCVIGDCFDMGWAEVQPTVPTANRSPSSNGTRY